MTKSLLPQDHPQRLQLNDEVHARPPGLLKPPSRISYLALRVEPAARRREIELLRELTARHEVAAPTADANHYAADLAPFRVRWEHHTEFARYMFITAGDGTEPFATTALAAVPEAWLAELPGETLVATHVELIQTPQEPVLFERLSQLYFNGNALVGSRIAGGTATAFTDLKIREDGFSRILVHNLGMLPRQSGRIVQRLLEIDTYRILALLALPVARELSPFLVAAEAELAEITRLLSSAEDTDEPRLLDRLTRLQAALEARESDNSYRFGAAAAYYDIVERRIAELRERRLEGLQTFEEFNERRLAPAMNTCRAISRRQESLSQRMARATQLLSTRVAIEGAHQNQALLVSMNRRAALQLRLQETVEGLSVAAVTYYVVGLVHYLAKSAAALGLGVKPDVVTAASIPVVAGLVALGVRRVRRMVTDGQPPPRPSAPRDPD